MKKIDVKIKVLSPIVLSTAGNSTIMTETRKTISGSVLRGIIANRYIETKQLGSGADKDEDFRDIFFESARFVDCNPLCQGERAIELPMSLRKEKEGTGGKKVPDIKDLLFIDNADEAKGYKSFKGLAAIKGSEVYRAGVKTVINFHMSRSGDEERLKGSSQDGAVYNYEAIREGQTFVGCIIGEEEVLNKMAAGLALENKSFEAHMGVSRYTQYGACSIELGQVTDIEAAPKNFAGKMAIRLDTAYIPEEEYNGNAKRGLEAVVDKLNEQAEGSPFTLGRVFAGNTEIDNFVGVWNMRRGRENALAAGTVFEVVREGAWTEGELRILDELMVGGCGRRREEGFGQMRLWADNGLAIVDLSKEKEDKEPHIECDVPDSVKKQIRKIVEKRILEQLHIYAFEDARKARSEMGTGMAHFFARLEQMLESVRNENSVREALAKELKKEREHKDNKVHDTQKARTPFQEHLEKMQIGDSTLNEYLDGSSELQPYLDKKLHKLADDLSDNKERIEALLELAGEKFDEKQLGDKEYFYEYWHWVFRYARKNAVKKRGRN